VVRVVVAVLCALFAVVAHAQTPMGPPAPIYDPEYGQPGKDVVWVPTPEVMVDTMLNLAKVTADDYVIDLGSGDGRLVIGAASPCSGPLDSRPVCAAQGACSATIRASTSVQLVLVPPLTVYCPPPR